VRQDGGVLIIRGTKKLRDRVRTATPATDADESTTLLGDWFANALFWKPQVALLVNTRTMLPVFMPLAPAATLPIRAPGEIATVLAEHGVPDDVVAAELEAMADVRVAPTNDRQLIGVMNELSYLAEGFRARSEPDLVALSRTCSGMILGPLSERHHTPRDELAALLGEDATVIPFPRSAERQTTDDARQDGRVHRLKVTLRDIEPPIWRRVVVDGGQTLRHLHEVIQASFGWYDSHLHEFEIGDAHYGIPDEDDWTPTKDERRVSIDQVVGIGPIRYSYDFGDGWEHDVVVEETRPADETTTTPDCLAGRRACPPEDCGGPWGYGELLEILGDPSHPEHRDRVEWIGRPFDPEAFDPTDFAENLRTQQTLRFDDRFR
jgi:hypothetical protein